MALVHGDRICRRCKGLCSTGSFRTRTGQRKQYWCSAGCFQRDHPGANLLGERTWSCVYERVDVIQRSPR